MFVHVLVSPASTTSVCGVKVAATSLRFTDQRPFASARAGRFWPANLTVTTHCGSAQPHTGTDRPCCRIMLSPKIDASVGAAFADATHQRLNPMTRIGIQDCFTPSYGGAPVMYQYWHFMTPLTFLQSTLKGTRSTLPSSMVALQPLLCTLARQKL